MEENIFTEEQIEELNKISQLPEEQQKKVLPEFLKKLTPEQLSYLKQTQPAQQCPFCLISENKINAKKIYEDNELIAALEINPANPGHTIIFPKKHYQILAQVKDVSHLFNIVNKISALLFNSLNAQGTNIIISNGAIAGQLIPHIVVNIVPRFKDDKLNFNLPQKKASEEELNKTLNKIKEKSEEFFSQEENISLPEKEEQPREKDKEMLKIKKERRMP